MRDPAAPRTLRHAWSAMIRADDYEAHMASVGQAQANAGLVRELFAGAPAGEGAAVLIAGSGTGQMFDYLEPAILLPYRTIFTDINQDFLDRLEARLEGHELAFDTAVDDIENSSLAGPFDLAIAVLVLEHVDWRRAVASLCRLAPRVFVVIQEDPPDLKPMPLVGTMNVLRELPTGRVDARELAGEFEGYGFRLQSTRSREVAHAKKMVGMDFMSVTSAPAQA